MKNAIFLSALVLCLLFGALFFAIQNPMLLSGGSNSLEVHVTPDPVQSWLSLGAFFAFAIAVRFSGWFKGRLGTITAVGLLSFSLAAMILNSHSFTLSGRQHAFIDRWLLVPTNKVSFDPAGDVSEYVVSDIGLLHSSIGFKNKPQPEMVIVTGLFGAGIHEETLIAHLKKFGLTQP